MSGKLKEVRERIASVNKTQQITRAMKLVSASKLRRAQQAIQQMRPYADKQQEILVNILSNLEGDVDSSFGVQREVKKVCLVIITSNRGLCGAFNTNIIKAAKAKIEAYYAAGVQKEDLSILPIGKKGFEFVKKNYIKDLIIIKDYVALFENLTFDNVSKVSQLLMDAFEQGTYDLVEVAYAQFKNAVVQIPQAVPFLPVPKIQVSENSSTIKANYLFEPDKEVLLAELIPSILQTQFQKYVLDTHASEHGARMSAMDNATENAEEIIKELKISYNKARQEAITREISEIVGGAASLSK
jgi:F-type H+-transporting ATPase subunit gamma